jgi:hypothetical protein
MIQPIDAVREQIEKIKDCNNVILSCTDLLIKFDVDSDCSNEIPETVKNGFIQGGLLAAIQIVADASEWLEENHKGGCL